jgi:hypothetical protein
MEAPMAGQDDPHPEAHAVERDLTVREIFGRMKFNEFIKFGGACLVLLGSVYSLGVSQPLWSRSIAAVPNSSAPPQENAESKVYYGYYGDLKDDGTTTISDEKLSIELMPNSEVKATAKGDVKSKDGRIPRVWNFHGFQKGYRLSMSFSTIQTKEDPIAPGIGVYVLEQEDSSDYTGTAIFLDCEKRVMIQCPYALTTQNVDVGNAKSRWPKLFERTCTVLDLVPDSSAKNAAIQGSCQLASAKLPG